MEYCRGQIDAINEKWRQIENRSDRKGEALAVSYRLYIHPLLWDAVRESLTTCLDIDRRPPIFPELKFLQLIVVVSDKIEGWEILEHPLCQATG